MQSWDRGCKWEKIVRVNGAIPCKRWYPDLFQSDIRVTLGGFYNQRPDDDHRIDLHREGHQQVAEGLKLWGKKAQNLTRAQVPGEVTCSLGLGLG